jgi:glycosyltransferase involved in cell wall biosynthesis
MKPLVSILIPAFNAQAWIADAIESAIGQTWPRKEIIVVDDGSTDQTLKLARQFASRVVAVVTQKNQGASAARNHALSLSQGDYFQWLDADDLLSPGKIRKQIEASEECRDTRTLFSSGWGCFAHRTATARFWPSSLWCDLSPVEWLLRKMGENLHMQTATWLVSRELTEAAGPWDVRLVNDNDGEYFCRVILASNGIRFVPEARVFYRRVSPCRVSYIGRSDKKKDARFLSMRLHVKYIRSLEDSDRIRAACINYLQSWLIVFYPERADIVEELEELARGLGGSIGDAPAPLEIRLDQTIFWLGASQACGTRVARVSGIFDKILGQVDAQPREVTPKRHVRAAGVRTISSRWRQRRSRIGRHGRDRWVAPADFHPTLRATNCRGLVASPIRPSKHRGQLGDLTCFQPSTFLHPKYRQRCGVILSRTASSEISLLSSRLMEVILTSAIPHGMMCSNP